MYCKHEFVEKERRVQPAGYKPFRMKYSECVHCGYVMGTPKQRKKNKKQANYAKNRYCRVSVEPHSW